MSIVEPKLLGTSIGHVEDINCISLNYIRRIPSYNQGPPMGPMGGLPLQNGKIGRSPTVADSSDFLGLRYLSFLKACLSEFSSDD